jgi:hypothetical protein
MHFFLKIVDKEDSGTCNQVYNMAGMLDYAIDNNVRILFIDKFLTQIHTKEFCNAGEIFDFKEINNYFGKKYNVYFVDGHTFTFNIIKITFVTENNTYDITQKVLDKYYRNENIFISKTDEISNICDCEPYSSIKYINVNYSVNEYVFNNKHFIKDKYLCNNLKYKFNNNFFFNPVVNRFHKCQFREIFFDFLENFKFHHFILSSAANYWNKLKIEYNIKNNEKINCIHLRLEDDIIHHLSNNHGIPFEICKHQLETKYIMFIKELIDKNHKTIILSHSYDNKVITFLRNANYNFIQTANLHKSREICAAMDLSVGEMCNNILLGWLNSTFTYTLYKKIEKKEGIKILLFDYFSDSIELI